MRGMRVLLICGAGLFGVGCAGSPIQPEDGPASSPDVTAYTAGAALQNLDGAGHFRLPAPVPPDAYPILSEAEAVAIAKGVIRTWYASPDVITLPGTEGFAESAERQHGAPIDWAAIEAGPTGAYYAVSHLQPLSLDLGWPTIRFYGPKFLVPLFVGATPVVVVAVSAYATNTSVGEDGRIVRTGIPSGGEFRVAGIPVTLAGVTLPPSPEAAVEFAAGQTGRRIVDVPRLGTPGNYILSVSSLWRLELESPVDLIRRFDGSSVSTSTVYVGLWPSIADARVGFEDNVVRLRMFVEADEQPEVQIIQDTEAPLVPGYAVDLHEVQATVEGGAS
jgi:hypothetical protein